MAAADAGAEDVTSDDGMVLVTCQPTDLMAVRAALESAGFDVERSELVLQPSTSVDLDEASARTTLNLVDALEDLDDVQKVWANFEISDDVFAAVAGD